MRCLLNGQGVRRRFVATALGGTGWRAIFRRERDAEVAGPGRRDGDATSGDRQVSYSWEYVRLRPDPDRRGRAAHHRIRRWKCWLPC